MVATLLIEVSPAGGMFAKLQANQSKTPTYHAMPLVNKQQTAPKPTSSVTDLTKVAVKISPDDPVLGSKNAKLTIVEFGDYQCPFSARFFKELEPKLRKEYIYTGKVKFVFKNLPFLGQESFTAANAALCAKEQDKFWQYHDKLYENQNGENQGAFSPNNLKQFAKDLKLNTAKFNQCLETNKFSDQIKADISQAKSAGFSGTPSLVVDDMGRTGLLPWQTFKNIVEEKLAK